MSQGKGTKQYGWVTGCSSTYSNWSGGSPDNQNNSDGWVINNGNNQDYAMIFPNGQWHDLSAQDLINCGCEYTPALTMTPSFDPLTAPSFRPTVSPSSGSTSSPIVTPSFTSSEGSVSE
jgi:hypothetical protein